MVRLGAKLGSENILNKILFQFQYGAIGSTCAGVASFPVTAFQFQYGAIGSDSRSIGER